MKLVVVVIIAGVVAGGTAHVMQKGNAAKLPPKAVVGATALNNGNMTPAGGVAFFPSPDHPVSWRGDGTGRYPAATPPIRWSRSVKVNILNGMRCQARKPADQQAKGDEPIEKGMDFNFITIGKWLTLGPIPVADPAKAAQEPVLAGEEKLEGDDGAKVDKLTWTDGPLDLEKVFAGKPNQCAYICTYLYTPTGGNSSFRWLGDTGKKAWVNGKSVGIGGPPDMWHPVTLNKGWNRVVCKTVRGENPVSLRLDVGISADAYETKNITWMTKLPTLGASCGASTPIVVGNRIYVITDPSDLVCINKADGKILWIKGNNYFEAATDEEKKANAYFKDKLEPMAAKIRELNDQIAKDLNAEISPTGVSAGKVGVINQKIKEKQELEGNLYRAMRELGAKYHLGSPAWSFTTLTPCSDGQRIYAWFGEGVGACYDLDGKRQWIFNKNIMPDGNAHHGFHSSPLITDGKLIVNWGAMWAFDCKTGKMLWEAHPQMMPETTAIGSVVLFSMGSEKVAVVYNCEGFNVSDGKQAWSQLITGGQCSTPVIEKGILYNVDRHGIYAAKLPVKAGEQPSFLYKNKEVESYYVASPLFLDGLVYSADRWGKMCLCEAEKGTVLYRHDLNQDLCIRSWSNIHAGITGSPASAGKYVYIMDNSGGMLVLEPGREFKKVAVNVLQNWNYSSASEPQEQFAASPVFDGKRLYLRGTEYLYCIEEK